MVERRPENYRWQVPRVRLFHEELVRLLEIFEEHGGTVKYQLGDYEFSGLAELDDVPAQRCNTLEFQSVDPYVSVDLRTHGGEVHASATSGPAARGMADQIRSVLEHAKHRRSLATLAAEWGVFVAIGLLANLYLYSAVENNDAVLVAALALTVVVAPWTYVSYKRSFTRPTHVIYLQPRSQHPGFFERNKDQLVLNGMSAVVGGVIGWLLGRA